MRFTVFFLALVLCVLQTFALKVDFEKKTDPCPAEKKLKKGDRIKVHYRGSLENGKEFDSSYKRNTPFEFDLGRGQVIKGWDQGLEGTCVGDKLTLTIPSNLGYGAGGVPGVIPPNSVLIFNVEVMGKN